MVIWHDDDDGPATEFTPTQRYKITAKGLTGVSAVYVRATDELEARARYWRREDSAGTTILKVEEEID